jgi:hypothetical protein
MGEWFRARDELVPYGSSPTAARLLAIAGARNFFSQSTWLRLKHLKDSLLGNVHVKKLDSFAFEAAAYLLLKLRLHFLLQRRRAESVDP